MLNLLRRVAFLIGFAALVLANACQSPTAAPPPSTQPSVAVSTLTPIPGPKMVSGAQYEGAIFADGAWMPDADMVAALETRLPLFLAQNQNKFNPTKPPIVERLPQYKRQYWGEMENGKRVIEVNAMCRALDGWQTQRIFIADGGDCFFNVKYNLDAGTFFDLSVNGEA